MSDEFYRFQLGEFACVVIRDGSFVGNAAKFFNHGPEGERESALRGLGVDPDVIPSNYLPLYVNTGAHQILIDTGTGDPNSPTSGKLLPHMIAAGIDPHLIDTVIFTHMHGDHIGGNCSPDGQPNFPNARYIASRTEWDHWSSAEVQSQRGEQYVQFWRKNMGSLKDRFEFVDAGREILPGVQVVTSHGHTPGHIALAMKSGNQGLLHVGDALHQPWHADFPDWGPSYDFQPAAAAAARRKLLNLTVADNLLMFAFHFPFPGLGRVVEKGDAWAWQPLET